MPKDPLHNSLRSVISRTRAVCCVVFLANSRAIGCKKTPCIPSHPEPTATASPELCRGSLVSRVRNSQTKSFDAREDVISRLCPIEWFGIGVVKLDIVLDRLLQLPGRAMRAAPDLLFGQRGKPALDLVEPGGRSGREVNMKPPVAGKPGLDGRGFVRAVVVHHQVDVQIGRHTRFDGAQELQELAAAMSPVQLTDRPLLWRCPAPQTASWCHGACSRGCAFRQCPGPAARSVACGRAPEFGSSRPRTAPWPYAADPDTARRCRAPSRRTAGRWRA